MRYLFSIILLLNTCSEINAQNSCDTVYFKSFYNFVNYDDSVGYSLTYNIEEHNHDCLKDTTELIKFIMSDRFNIVNSNNIIANKKEIIFSNVLLGPNLARNTKYKKRISRVDPIKISLSPTMDINPDVMRLYFIHALFYQNFQFKKRIILGSDKKTVKIYTDEVLDVDFPDETVFNYKTKNYKLVEKAMVSYRKWEKKLDKSNLKELREKGVHPLFYVKKLKWVEREIYE